MCSTLSQLPPAGFQCLKNESIVLKLLLLIQTIEAKKNYKWGTLYCRVSGSILLCHRLGRTCSRIGYDGEKENGRGDWSAKPQNVFSFYGFSVMLLAFSFLSDGRGQCRISCLHPTTLGQHGRLRLLFSAGFLSLVWNLSSCQILGFTLRPQSKTIWSHS